VCAFLLQENNGGFKRGVADFKTLPRWGVEGTLSSALGRRRLSRKTLLYSLINQLAHSSTTYRFADHGREEEEGVKERMTFPQMRISLRQYESRQPLPMFCTT
jgi:hypothetical protein